MSPAASFRRLVHGDDDWRIQRECRRILEEWERGHPRFDTEIVDGQDGDWDASLGAFLSAVSTPSLFAPGKIVWWRNCPLSSPPASRGKAGPKEKDDLVRRLEGADPARTLVLISCFQPDRRLRRFRDLAGLLEATECPSLESLGRQAQPQAVGWVRELARARGKSMGEDVAEQLVEWTGRDWRLLESECEKAVLHAGEAGEVSRQDVEATVWPSRQLRAFAFLDAVGRRDLAQALDRLEDELFGMKGDSRRSEIGLLYSLSGRFRLMLILRDLLDRKLLAPTRSSSDLRSRLERLDPEAYPKDRRFNPLMRNPFEILNVLAQAGNYSRAELRRGLEILLEANRLLITIQVEPAALLRQCIMDLVQGRG